MSRIEVPVMSPFFPSHFGMLSDRCRTPVNDTKFQQKGDRLINNSRRATGLFLGAPLQVGREG